MKMQIKAEKHHAKVKIVLKKLRAKDKLTPIEEDALDMAEMFDKLYNDLKAEIMK